MKDLELINIADLSEAEILSAIQKNPHLIIDRVEQTEAHCLAAVQQAGHLLRFIPKSIQTYEICRTAVEQDGSAIKYASKRLISQELCWIAVHSKAQALCYIPDKYLDAALLNKVIASDGSAIQYVPQGKRTDELYEMAIQQNPAALPYIPKKFLTKELLAKAIAQNGLLLEHIPGNRKSKPLCEAAVQQNPEALEFVPNRYKTISLCEKAVTADWRVFHFIPDSLLTPEYGIKFFQHILKLFEESEDYAYENRCHLWTVVAGLPDQINNDPQVISLQRKLKVRTFISKTYDSEKHIFVTQERLRHQNEIDTQEFSSFSQFYEYLEGDLSRANLYAYDFQGVDLKQFSIEGARIRSSVLVEQGMYDSSFYDQAVSDLANYSALTLSAGNELIPAESVLHESDISTALNNTSRKIYYISDIHLNHKLLKAYPKHATRFEIIDFIDQTIDKLLATATEKSYEDYLLIAGDVSFNFDIAVLFYKLLLRKWRSSKIIVTLGNHELWDYNYKEPKFAPKNREASIERYRKLFDELGIIFLHNDLFVLQGYEHHVIHEDQLNSIAPEPLKELCLRSNMIVFGGLGYSGYNQEYNALCGLYRHAVRTLDDDIAETKRFEALYDKLNGIIGDSRVIVLTHMQRENWSTKAINPNWIYVNGHTHRNCYICDGEQTVYSDNQIGYLNRVGLKFFRLSKTYDVFRHYPDGIHTITREQYLDFNRGMQINVTFNRAGGILYMLKNAGVYCFVYENSAGKYLLNGGAIKKLKHFNLEYYFNRLPVFTSAVKTMFSGYHSAMKALSEAVRKLGGSGTVHGSIIDIDFLNHLYINPEDGTITPYYALSIIEKYVYPDVRTLLLEQRKDLYDNYMLLLSGRTDGMLMLDGTSNVPSVDMARFVPETHMYRPSRIMRSVQYLNDANIVRIWDDDVIERMQAIAEGNALMLLG